jgi:DNA helicase-2/ATP-dependent DNA helicase PcrA
MGINWSEEQEAIFAWFANGEGNLVVRARAGTGKTTTIIAGIDHAPERKILLASFNKSIERELSARLKNPNAQAKTLHGLGFAFLRRNWTRVRVDASTRGWDLARTACDKQTPDPVIKLVKELHTKAREVIPFAVNADDAVSQIVDLAFRFDLTPGEEWEEEGYDVDRVAAFALSAMREATKRTAVIDFADMIYLPLVNGWVRPWFDLVVVDEAQDMNEAQLALATRACKRQGRLCIVGDDRQAIYGFRGADSGSLDRLKKELRATELGLRTTYRCPKTVVAEAQKFVPDFVAHDTAPEGEVKRDVSAATMLEDATEGDFILSRKNAPLVGICLGLLKRGRRARIQGRDIGKSIELLVKSFKLRQLADLEEAVANWFVTEQRKAKRIKDDDVQAAYLDEAADRRDVILALSDGVASVPEYMARLDSLFSDNGGASVMCSSVHKSKGLEADRVYLITETFSEGGEEDNITYVAVTRAKATLGYSTGEAQAEVVS